MKKILLYPLTMRSHFDLLLRLFFKFKSNSILGNIFSRKIFKNYGVQLTRSANIDSSIIFPHPTSVIIGEFVTIKEDCKIFQNVTLGLKNPEDGSSLEIKKKSYPIIEKNVVIYPNSTVVGSITVGENSIIGSNSFVDFDVPSNTIVAGNPARIVKKVKK